MTLFNCGFCILLVVTFLFSYGLTLAMTKISQRYNWVARPCDDRWNCRVVALHGGVGFVLPFLLSALFWLYFRYDLNVKALLYGELPQKTTLAVAALAGAVLLYFCGLWDDTKKMSPTNKLICQVAATSLFVYAGGIYPLTDISGVNLFITYLWFVGLTNAFNLLDNMDGLSAGVAFVAAVFAAMVPFSAFEIPVTSTWLALLFAACLLGYWLHNKFPAKIFMGDSGSLPLGFVIAALTMPSQLNANLGLEVNNPVFLAILLLLIPMAILAVPIFDTSFVTITRLLGARKIHQGGTDHTSHRLVHLGLSERRAVMILFCLGITGGAVAIFSQRNPDLSLSLIGAFALLLICFGAYLTHVQISVQKPENGLPLWNKFLLAMLVRRNMAQVFLDTILVITCFWGAHLLRFEFMLNAAMRQAVVQALPLVVVSSLLGLRLAGAYGSSWRLASLSDTPSYALGVILGTSMSLALSTIFSRFGEGYSRSSYITFAFLLFIAVTVSRQSFFLLDTWIKRKTASRQKDSLTSVLIYGAGKGGMILLEESLFNESLSSKYCVLGFVDDDSNLLGHKVGGLHVRKKDKWLHEVHDTPEIWISSKSISDAKALAFASRWSPKAVVKRQVLSLSEVSD